MGNRGQVVVEDVGVVLYVHLGGHNLYEAVANTLRATDRDLRPDYLVHELVDRISEDGGGRRVGIQSTEVEHSYRTIRLNHVGELVTVSSIYDDEDVEQFSYSEFIEEYRTESVAEAP